MIKSLIFYLLLFFSFLSMPAFADDVLTISSDSTWKASKLFFSGWEKFMLDDSAWVATASPSIGTCTLGKQKPSFTTPMWHPKATERQTVYFRKTFDIKGVLKAAQITLAFDDDGELYINQKKVYTDASGKTEPIAVTLDISEYLVEGENLFAIKVMDPRGGCQWVQLVAEISMEPSEASLSSLFLQTDQRWKDEIYAGGSKDMLDCGTTIADCGCAVSSLAMLLNGYGITKGPAGEDVNPKTLNQYFLKDQKCSNIGCISLGYVFGAVRWSAAHGYSVEAHNLFNTPKVQYFGKYSFDKETLKTTLRKEKVPIIAKDPHRSHWFVLNKVDGSDISILDPIFGNTTLDRQYGGIAGNALDFQEVHSDFSAIEIYVKKDVSVELQDLDGKKISMEKFEEEFPESVSPGELQHYVYNHPPGGTYRLKANKPNTALYVSDQNGSEIFHLAESLETEIKFDPKSVKVSKIADSVPLSACLGRPLPLRFPIIFTVKADKNYTYEGELIARTLLKSIQ